MRVRAALFLITCWVVGLNRLTVYAGVWQKLEGGAPLHISSLITTPWGIVAGENDSRIWLNPKNGVHISKDFGNTWNFWGLQNTGVTDLAYDSSTKNLYASTYYINYGVGGLFRFKPTDSTWEHLGPTFSTSAVAAEGQNIYLGGYSHGLWVSNDNGISWTQKIGSGWTGPEIKDLKVSGSLALAATTTSLLRSTDDGQTWTEIPFFSNKGAKYLVIYNEVIFAAPSSGGIYKSLDSGETWSKAEGFGNSEAGFLFFDPNSKSLLAGKLVGTTTYSIFQSFDFGGSWTDLGLTTSSSYKSVGIAWAFSEPKYFYTSLSNAGGLHRYSVPKATETEFPFLDIPWQAQKHTELSERIFSFFDHEYPFLGYYYYSEPTATRTTTVNYNGFRAVEPYLYYSSHNGTDFALPYGTPIIAPADGAAIYSYCTGCGNSIKIDHLNGYQTTYMHLQKSGLVTTNSVTPTTVLRGQVIGKVGMTGNTTGPHLHFEVTRDTNSNGQFSDEYPIGKTDPFGWQAFDRPDPWPNFSWSDALGVHNGTSSMNLWIARPTIYSGITYTNSPISTSNKTLSFGGFSGLPATVFAQDYAIPSTASNDFVPQSSMLIQAYNSLGSPTNQLEGNYLVQMIIDDQILSNFDSLTLRFVYFDEQSSSWIELPTIYDSTSGMLETSVSQAGWIAIVGQKLDRVYPTTFFTSAGGKAGNWFTEYPTLSFQVQDPDSPPAEILTFYTIDGEGAWQNYTPNQQIAVEKNGIIDIQFRSSDSSENLEPTNSAVLLIDTQNKWKKQLRVVSATFETASAPSP